MQLQPEELTNEIWVSRELVDLIAWDQDETNQAT